MNKIICIGSSTKDIIFPVIDGHVIETPEDLESQRKINFELGAKYQINGNRHESIGGCAANVACGLARLGEQAFCCTRVGGDQAGNWIKNELEKNGVAIDLLQIDGECQSDLSFILAHIPSEDRIIFSDRDANEKLEVAVDDIEKISAKWIFASSLNGNEKESWEIKMDKVLALIKAENISLIFNPGQKNIKNNPQKIIEAIGQSQIVIVNKDEAIEIVEKSGDFTMEDLNTEKFLLEKLRALGARVIVLTDGANGSWGFDGRELVHADSRKEKIADTLGAGDAFSSGFIAAQIKGLSLKECLHWGVLNSSSVVGAYGAVQGLLHLSEMHDRK